MKKILFFFCFLLLCATATQLLGNTEMQDACFTGALTAGYVFKHDCRFKDVYGRGIVNIITADGCYYPWDLWGIGAKLSYWRAKGCTTFLNQRSVLQELPVTFYLRRLHNFTCDLQMYASLGGGLIWLKEKSYLGEVRLTKGIGEVEVGLHYSIWRCINLTTAFRYLFPSQCQKGERANIGGFDLRAGIGISF